MGTRRASTRRGRSWPTRWSRWPCWRGRAADIPATLGGAARFQVANALAALAASRALGVSADEAGAALTTFQSDWHNPGRMNLYRVERGYVVVDYGHNPGAFQALCDLA